MKKAQLLLVCLLALTACNSNKISYNGFSLSFPEPYIIDNIDKLGADRYYLLSNEDAPNNFAYIQVMPDYVANCGLSDPTNLDISQQMLLLIDELADNFFFSEDGVEIDEDFGFTIKTPEREDIIPNATAELRGAYDGLPFRAYFAADLWGDNMVVSLFCAEDDNEMKKQIQEIFLTYEWHI